MDDQWLQRPIPRIEPPAPPQEADGKAFYDRLRTNIQIALTADPNEYAVGVYYTSAAGEKLLVEQMQFQSPNLIKLICSYSEQRRQILAYYATINLEIIVVKVEAQTPPPRPISFLRDA